MGAPKANDLKKYLNGLIKINRKYVTADRLSKYVGVYPEIINEHLSYFEPTLKMDPEFNLMELIPEIKKYLIEQEENKTLVKKQPVIKKKDVEKYESINDFVYKKMTSVGGLLDRNVVLSDIDLKILKKLVSDEQNYRKTHK